MGEQKGRMLRGEWYLDEPDLAEERRRCWRILDSFNATGADDDAERHRILSGLLGKFAPGASVLPRFQCSYGLGGGVIVCPGVTIGENTVVGAGSVVVRDLPDHVFAAGNPARLIRRL
jgi:maltose acetyltransferase-like protein